MPLSNHIWSIFCTLINKIYRKCIICCQTRKAVIPYTLLSSNINMSPSRTKSTSNIKIYISIAVATLVCMSIYYFFPIILVFSPTYFRALFPARSNLPSHCPDPGAVLIKNLNWDQRRWDSRVVVSSQYSIENHSNNLKGYLNGVSLHHYSNWHAMNVEEWREFVINSIAPLHIDVDYNSSSNLSLYEAGCGVCAFVIIIKELFPKISIAGSDLSDYAVQVANQQVQGEFCVASALDLSYLSNVESTNVKLFDYVVASAVMYAAAISILESVEFVNSLVSITKPKGKIYIGYNVDSNTRCNPCGSGSYNLPVQFWPYYAQQMCIESIYITRPFSDPIRYNVYATKMVNCIPTTIIDESAMNEFIKKIQT